MGTRHGSAAIRVRPGAPLTILAECSPVTARTLIWTPVPTAKLQLRLHEEGEGPAVLVPVGSGTVVLPAPAARFPRAVALARTCLRIGERALAVRWDNNAVTAHP